MKTNIFITQYEQQENKLTYNYICLIEHLGRESQALLLRKLFPALHILPEELELQCELLYGGQESNPDGAFYLSTEGSAYTVYFENKTFRRKLDPEQIKNHLVNFCPKDSELLLVITTDPSDRKRLRKKQFEDKVFFHTWSEIVTILKELARSTESEKDIFLIDEFVAYGNRTGEFMELASISDKDIADYSEYLELQERTRNFSGKWRYILESCRESLDSAVRKFPDIASSSSFLDHFGRCGYDYYFKTTPYGQWLSIGLYYDTYDHQIPFKRQYVPELAIFYDIKPTWRDSLRSNPELLKSLEYFESNQFENNLTKSITPNRWRFVFHRKPITELGEEITPRLVSQFFEEKLGFFFANQRFFKCMGHKECISEGVSANI
jgi:hypothetical protein